MSATSKRYILACLIAAFLGFWSLSSIYILSWFTRLTGVDILYLVGSGAVLGPKKIPLIDVTSWLLSISLVVLFVASLTKPGRLERLLSLICTLPILLTIPYWTAASPLGRHSQSIQSEYLPVENYKEIFTRPSEESVSLTSYQAFLEDVDRRYIQYREQLQSDWPDSTNDERFVLFALNFAANFYAFGNKDIEKPGGCAVLNEHFGDIARNQKEEGSDFYLKSPIGCCTDYAVILKLILDYKGFENNIVSLLIHGHTFNEVKIEDKWHTIDANIGVFYSGRWNDIVDAGTGFKATLFPVLSLQGNAPQTYRSSLGPFRNKTMMILATGSERTTVTNSPALTIDQIE